MIKKSKDPPKELDEIKGIKQRRRHKLYIQQTEKGVSELLRKKDKKE